MKGGKSIYIIFFIMIMNTVWTLWWLWSMNAFGEKNIAEIKKVIFQSNLKTNATTFLALNQVQPTTWNEQTKLRRFETETFCQSPPNHFFLPATFADFFRRWLADEVGRVFSKSACWASSRACFSSCFLSMAAIWRLLRDPQASWNVPLRCREAAWSRDGEAKRRNFRNDV